MTSRALPVVLLLFAAGCYGALTPAEERGRQIYQVGESPSHHRIQAETAGGAVPGSLAACGTCHGRDGTGSSEGGVTPTSIRWIDLTRSYPVVSPNRRRHAAYDEELFGRAIALGIDPAGNRLDFAMPRFRMSTQDTSDLLAWLKHLGESAEEGLTSGALVIGSLLPSKEAGSIGAAMRDGLEAYFARINRLGGIYGRRIDFRPVTLTGERTARGKSMRAFLEHDHPFALVASFISGFEREADEILREKEVPLVGAYTPLPVIDDPPNPEVFYIDGGLRSQAEALARFAERHFRSLPHRISVVASSEQIFADAANGARTVLMQKGWTVDDSPSGSIALILIPPDSRASLMENSSGMLLLPGLLAEAGAAQSKAARESRLFLAYPTLPSDYESAASADYETLAESAVLPKQFVSAQLMALASARLLVEGLLSSGRELSRGKLIGALENLWEFQTGFTAPVTFTPNRRIGFSGSRIVRPDPNTGSLVLVEAEP